MSSGRQATRRAWQRALPLALLLLAACAHAPRHPGPARPPATVAPATVLPHNAPDVSQIPDAIPREEPRSASGNPPFYVVAGHRYVVLPSASGYVERGVASWYGTEFHGLRTSTGESYDMFAMTAAHKTLPLPCYARVTNLSNGRNVVVRINDRGPFVANRIIDLSYSAANRLDMIRNGTAFVQVEVLSPSAPSLTASMPVSTPAAQAASVGVSAVPAMSPAASAALPTADGTRCRTGRGFGCPCRATRRPDCPDCSRCAGRQLLHPGRRLFKGLRTPVARCVSCAARASSMCSRSGPRRNSRCSGCVSVRSRACSSSTP